MSEFIYLNLKVFSIVGGLGAIFLVIGFLQATDDYKPKYVVSAWVFSVPTISAMTLCHQWYFEADWDQLASFLSVAGWYFFACLLLGHFCFLKSEVRFQRWLRSSPKYQADLPAQKREVEYTPPPFGGR